MQFCLLFLMIGGLLLISMKNPKYVLISNLIAQIFGFHFSYKAWKEARQIGIFINTILFTFITSYGIINYWFL